ncbi:MAG: cyclic nucleotide-binding domain-containing protein [Mariprofundaceae bacterium]|nr:cyclic nucleotide-binding domain-containing protein [Mariprofundaceae bacterium]
MTEKKPVSALWHNYFKQQGGWIEDAAKKCEENLLFKGLSPTVIRWFASKMHPREYRAGENIFHAGDEGAGAILLRTGSIAIRSKGVDLAVIKPGDMFGEVALVDGQARTADAVAIEPCKLVFLLRTDLDDWINSQPKHAGKLLKNLGAMLARRLLECNKSMAKKTSGDISK